MKTIITILISLISILGQAQSPEIDTLYFGGNVSHVVKYFHYDNDDEKIISKYYFNEKGFHVLTYYGYNDRKQRRTLLEYEKNGLLKLTKGERYISPKNDSIGNALDEEMIQLMKSNIDIESEEWAQFNERYSTSREIVNPEQVKWKSNSELSPEKIVISNITGQDSIVEYYSSLNSNETYLDEKVFHFYNEFGQLKRKLWVDIPHENVFEFQAFKPNSLELADSIKILTNSFREKSFTYFQDSVKIAYSVNGQFTGSEIRRTINDGFIKEEIVFDANNDTLSYFVEHYDTNKRKAMRHRVKHNGYNGFGYSLDLAWGDIKKYKYDWKKRLVRIDGFDKDVHIFTERYEIIEK